MSRMAFTPFREVAINALKVRQHRSSFASNLLPKLSRLQASRSRSYQLPPKTLTPSNRGAIALPMSRRMRKVEAASTSTSPLANPMERITGRFAAWADQARPDPALTPAHGWHRPFLQSDLDLDASRLDHDRLSAGPGKPRERGVG
jgi:hypothetical protein